jgi:hypothetical protein
MAFRGKSLEYGFLWGILQRKMGRGNGGRLAVLEDVDK